MAQANNRPNRNARKRTPIGRRDILNAPEREGYKRRFVNDEPGRIQQFLDAGYKIVDDGSQSGDLNVGEASQVGSVSGKPVGGGMNAVLMEIREDWYQEDQTAKMAHIDEKEQSMLNDEGGKAPDQRLTYGEGVKIKRPTVQTE